MDPLVASALVGGGAQLLGSGISSILGAATASEERKAAERRKRQANEQLTSWERQAKAILDEAMGKNVQLSSPSDVEAYRQMRSSYDPSSYTYKFEPFDKSSYHVEDYLNPNKEAILADVRKQAQHTAAGAGLGHSSGALEAIEQALINKDEELYNRAREQMNTERNFDYGAYTDYIRNKQAQLTAIQEGRLNQMGQLRGDIQFDQQQQDAYLANRLNLGNTIAQTRAQLV